MFDWFQSPRRRRPSPARHPRSSFRPCLESLESRLAPSGANAPFPAVQPPYAFPPTANVQAYSPAVGITQNVGNDFQSALPGQGLGYPVGDNGLGTGSIGLNTYFLGLNTVTLGPDTAASFPSSSDAFTAASLNVNTSVLTLGPLPLFTALTSPLTTPPNDGGAGWLPAMPVELPSTPFATLSNQNPTVAGLPRANPAYSGFISYNLNHVAETLTNPPNLMTPPQTNGGGNGQLPNGMTPAQMNQMQQELLERMRLISYDDTLFQPDLVRDSDAVFLDWQKPEDTSLLRPPITPEDPPPAPHGDLVCMSMAELYGPSI
jgi:hypothetical protein